jgi:hypothetical protein
MFPHTPQRRIVRDHPNFGAQVCRDGKWEAVVWPPSQRPARAAPS